MQLLDENRNVLFKNRGLHANSSLPVQLDANGIPCQLPEPCGINSVTLFPRIGENSESTLFRQDKPLLCSPEYVKAENSKPLELNFDPIKVMDQFCWCKFNYKDYGLTKDQVKQINEIMIEKASDHLKYEDFDGCMTRDSVYLQLLSGFDYKHVEVEDPDTGKTSTAYKCMYEECGKQFSRAWNLLNHARMHEGVKPYACQICHKSFTQKGNLKKHMMTHLLPQIENRKRYKCEFCSKGYTEKYNYMVS